MTKHLRGGDSIVAQVIERVTPRCLAVWDLDNDGRWHAHDVDALDFNPGDIVTGRVDPACWYVDTIEHADTATKQAYANKLLIP